MIFAKIREKFNRKMELQNFKTLCKRLGYSFVEEGDKLIVTAMCNVYFDFNIKSIPTNIIFRNHGCVSLQSVTEIPKTTVFENKGNINLKFDAIIPNGFKGFKHTGQLFPENIKYCKPRLSYIFSDEFIVFLDLNIKYPFINKIKQSNGKIIQDENPQITFIKCSGEDISFVPVTNIIKNYQNNKEGQASIYNYINNLTVRKRYFKSENVTVKAGRFIKKMVSNISDAEVEEFVNLYKSFINNDSYEMSIVHGEDIRKYYNRANQDAMEANGGSLYNSCMNYKEETDPKYSRLVFYTKVPNVGLLILKDKGSEKIKGRALIWTAVDGRKYIDYVYITKPAERYLFKKYAEENDCLSNMNNDPFSDLVIECPDEVKNLSEDNYMTYLDTFKYHKNQNLIKGNHNG